MREYIELRSEAAFAELMRRHVDLIYSAALRMVCASPFSSLVRRWQKIDFGMIRAREHTDRLKCRVGNHPVSGTDRPLLVHVKKLIRTQQCLAEIGEGLEFRRGFGDGLRHFVFLRLLILLFGNTF